MRSLSGCSRSVFPSVPFPLCQSAVFLLLIDRTIENRATRHLEALVLTRQPRAVRFERLSSDYYCSAAAKNRLACTELLSGPGLPTERVHARSYLTLPCYCSAAGKSRSACTELLFGPGLPTEWVHTRFELKLPRYSSPAANSRLPALNCCLALSFQPTGLIPDLSYNACCCSSVSAKSRFSCTELLSGPGLPTERVHARFGLKLPRHRSAAAISPFSAQNCSVCC